MIGSNDLEVNNLEVYNMEVNHSIFPATLLNQRVTVLGIDFGTRQQGLAVAEMATENVQPLQVVRASNRKQAIEQIVHIGKEWNIVAYVIGYPSSICGDNCYSTNRSLQQSLKRFVHELSQCHPLPIFFEEEHFSSVEARQIKKTYNLQRNDDRVDDLAAAVILQRWVATLKTQCV